MHEANASRIAVASGVLPYNGIRNESSVRELAKILRHVWLKIKIPNRRAAKQSAVDNRTPHDRVMNQVQCAKDRRVHNDQREHRDHNVTRPRFCHRESIADARYQNSNRRHQRRSDVQPLRPRDALAAHDVRPDIENRQHNRQVHAERSQRRKPCQNSDEEWLLGFCHEDNYELIARR
jgi:hypothetical protein